MGVLAVVLLIVVLCAPAIVIGVLRNEGRRARLRTDAAVVRVDGTGVRRELADGRVEEVWWSEVLEVDVLRANIGPHKHAGGVVLIGGPGERGALVPLDRVGATGLLGYLNALDGFDGRRFDAAVASRAPSRTEVWRRPVSPP